MKPGYVTFPGGDISLEGAWHFPRGNGPFPVVIICHPHPLYGGDMANNVVLSLCQALPRQGMAAFRFNFRGVGRSEGGFGGGIAEQSDVTAALDLVVSTAGIDSTRIGLAGYSFGASVALPVAVRDSRAKLLALVSPALTDSGWQQLKNYLEPWLLISGDRDSVLPLTELKSRVKELPEPGQWQVIAGADHFWLGFEDQMAERVTGFFVTGFQRP